MGVSTERWNITINPSTLIRDLNLAEPAQRALEEAGMVTLQDVSDRSIHDLLTLHGVGPKTIRQLTPLLEVAGLSFKQ